MNHKNLVARRFSTAAFLGVIAAVIGLLPASIQASPADEISRAVIAAGAPSVKQADAATFTRGFTAVVIRIKCRNIAPYVTAGVLLRTDLAPQITVAALNAHHRNGETYDTKDVSCECVDPIIRAAIAAAPEAKKAIVKASLEADLWAKECIIAAAGLDRDTETAFFRPPGVDAGNINGSAIGTLNPANVGGGGGGQGNVNTPETP